MPDFDNAGLSSTSNQLVFRGFFVGACQSWEFEKGEVQRLMAAVVWEIVVAVLVPNIDAPHHPRNQVVAVLVIALHFPQVVAKQVFEVIGAGSPDRTLGWHFHCVQWSVPSGGDVYSRLAVFPPGGKSHCSQNRDSVECFDQLVTDFSLTVDSLFPDVHVDGCFDFGGQD